MAAACALAIFSGKIIYKFGIPERLRTLRYSLFMGKETPSVACGDSSPKGTPFGNAAKLPATAKAVPLGKVAATNGSRRKGYPSENVIFYNLWNMLKFFTSAD